MGLHLLWEAELVVKEQRLGSSDKDSEVGARS